MKKLMSLLMVLAFMMTGVCALAETEAAEPAEQTEQTEQTEQIVLDWETVEPYVEQNKLDGAFYVYEDYGIRYWVPAMCEKVTLTDEQIADGWIDAFGNDNEELTLVIQYTNVGSGATFEDIANAAADQIKGAGLAKINGFNAMMCDLATGNQREVFIGTDQDGYFLSFTYTGTDNPEYEQYINCAIASIMPYSAN